MSKTFKQRNLRVEAERAKLRELRAELKATAEKKQRARNALDTAELLAYNSQEWGGMAVELAAHAKRRGY